ncbi:protein-disulfide reductase DsbD domain-containing protein [Mucilaginibacter rubeus]|uniref:protein-disulfide reductase DsbD domain-containing protein n=1 Tax=Mucilaginibacter rubeus TaxID=2027860 RepID=UPI000DCE39CA|nr:protein-disulfide reductase DsbD domain-containing protein [Mucilaginibacter rubeus]
MKKVLMALVVLLASLQTKAQILEPVHWSYAAKSINAKEAMIYIKASIDNGWHVYSQNVKDGGPVKTTITFAPSKAYTLIGGTTEPKPITRMEKAFGMDVSFFETSVIFQQKIKLNAGQTTVTGKLEYMTCNDQKCLPPAEIAFSIPVK